MVGVTLLECWYCGERVRPIPVGDRYGKGNAYDPGSRDLVPSWESWAVPCDPYEGHGGHTCESFELTPDVPLHRECFGRLKAQFERGEAQVTDDGDLVGISRPRDQLELSQFVEGGESA